MEKYEEFLEEIKNFVFVEEEPEKADIIFVPGNGYPQMAERAAQLYKDGFAPYILPSGKYSIEKGKFSGVLAKKERYCMEYETEWEFLKDVLVKNGVPEEAILKENRATFTYENAKFSKEVTENAGITVRKAILCCKSCHARRALMYYQHVFPEAEILTVPVAADGISRQNWNQTEKGVEEVLGEVSRIIRQFSFMM